MPLPGWLGAVNKHVFNSWEIRNGVRPVLRHVGRTSGHEYETPLATYAVDGGFLFVMMYGPSSDWVQNILEAGQATLHMNGDEIDLDSPRVISMDEATMAAP